MVTPPDPATPASGATVHRPPPPRDVDGVPPPGARRAAMHARAAVSTAYVATPGRPGGSRLVRMRSQAPLVLRPTAIARDWPVVGDRPDAVRVSLAAGAAGPVGGDQLFLDVHVGPHSTLVLDEVSARLLLPGPHDEASHTRATITVGTGGTFVWLPQPVIAAHGCRHRNDVRVELDDDASLLLREELILGRHGEPPGTVAQHVRVHQAGRALYDQQLKVGPGAAGWDSPAVAGRNRALGSLLVVDPAWTSRTPPSGIVANQAAVLPLAGPAVLVSASSPDSLALRRALLAGLGALGNRWASAGHRE